MLVEKSLDVPKEIIVAMLTDVHNVYGDVFNTRALRLTINKVNQRVLAEGIGFLTKSMPRLAKAFDKALAGGTPLTATACGFKPLRDSRLPSFLGEFFSRVLDKDGVLLSKPCPFSVRVIRQILYPFYKYELPFTHEQEQTVISKFKNTESDLTNLESDDPSYGVSDQDRYSRWKRGRSVSPPSEVAHRAKRLLGNLFAFFDPLDIYPRHGPGAVSTGERLSLKYRWYNVSAKITDMYPWDAYFCASSGHFCDTLEFLKDIESESKPAKVVLVPKDSRGPRLISCEPVDYQWIQQGLGRAIVKHVEAHPLTKWNVRFTDQLPNRIAALYGSGNGRYATLDLNEASDRVSTSLVRLLFPEHLSVYLEACRSTCTVLPDGEVLPLKKFAPMGSALCFPVLALTVWALLTAVAPDADTRESIYVYGDDVIVPTANAENAMNTLELFGLKINRSKSCTSGLFRESCGMDAFNGVDVTPVRFRTVWASHRSPDVYESWIAYANSLFDRRYYRAYEKIVGWLTDLYGPIPSDSQVLELDQSRPSDVPNPHGFAPSLRESPTAALVRRRWNRRFQKHQFLVNVVKATRVEEFLSGWEMLLRFFAEAASGPTEPRVSNRDLYHGLTHGPGFRVSSYTKRGASILVPRWR